MANKYGHRQKQKARVNKQGFKIGVKKMCYLKTKFMEPSISKLQSCYKVYIVANNVLYQNQSLFFSLPHCFSYNHIPKSSQKMAKK